MTTNDNMMYSKPVQKRMIMILCIVFNLIIGNLILYLMWKDSFSAANGDGWFNRPNITMSLSGILCYWFLFTKIPFQKWGLFKLSLLSVAAWLATLFIGAFINTLTFREYMEGDGTITGSLLAMLIPFAFGICGTAMFSFIAIPMGLVNVVWLVLAKKE